MIGTASDRMLAAHAAQREKAQLSGRLEDARDDASRLTRELARANRVVANEQADVDGFCFWGRLAATKAELVKEQGELDAAVLQRDAVAEELRAAELYVRELEARAAAVCNADIEYEIALAEKEQQLRLDPGPVAAKLAALDTAERDARTARRQILEALNAARSARQRLAMIVVTLATVDGAELGAAQHLLGIYQRECKEVLACSLEVPVTPMRGVEQLVARELAWNKLPAEPTVARDLGELIRMIDETAALLRERDAQLERGLGRLLRERANAVDS
ncbi:hypothetical protein BH11MYX3_BH11MYX3_33230 [soil metagenome]